MNILKIKAPEFAERLRSEQALTIDLRTHAEFNSERLDQCVHLPLQSLDQNSFNAAIGSSESVYLLCQSGRRAEMAIEKIGAKPNLNIVIIEGGLNALKATGVKVLKGDKKVIDLERQVRIAAGCLVFLGVILSVLVHPYFIWMSGFVGAGLVFAGITNTCAMGLLIARMPWNKA